MTEHLLNLLRFRRLDKHNCDEAGMTRLMAEAADEIERLTAECAEHIRKRGEAGERNIALIADAKVTKREYLASAALQGLLASAPMCDRTKVNKSAWARVAVEFADALLAELRKDQATPRHGRSSGRSSSRS